MALAPFLPSATATTFDSLPDDSILCIIDELKNVNDTDGHWGGGERDASVRLQVFSSLNKRIRQLTIPFIFDLQRLTIGLRKNEDKLIEHLEALRQSFAGPKVLALAVSHIGDPVDPLDYEKFKTIDSTAQLGQQIVAALPSLSGLKELCLSDIKILDKNAKAVLRQTTLDTVEALSIAGVPDAAFFIRACPNLVTFKSEFPCNKMKTTFKALSESAVVNLELRNSKSWKSKQFEGLCQYLGHISHLSLMGQIKFRATELVPSLAPLQTLQNLTLSTEPWVNTSYYSRRYMDDRYLDAIDDAQEWSPLNEDPTEVARAAFGTLVSLESAQILAKLRGSRKYRVVRHADHLVKDLAYDIVDMYSWDSTFATLFRTHGFFYY